jgi:hypothetical protein
MIDGRNFCLIIASNAIWCTHVSPIYWTFFHLNLQDSLLVAYCGLFIVATWCCFICGMTTCWGFTTSFDAPLSSLMDSIASPKVNTAGGEGVEAHFWLAALWG